MSYSFLVIAGLGLGAAIGFWRGWLREIVTLAGLLVGWLILDSLGGLLIGFVNHMYLSVAFFVRDGVDSAQPVALIHALRATPLVEPRHPGIFFGVLMTAAALGAYFAATRFVAPANGWSSQAIGTLVGLANGYIVTYLGFRFFAPTARLDLALAMNPNGIADSLGQFLPTVLIAGVVVAIAVALLSGRRLAPRGGPRPATGRSKG